MSTFTLEPQYLFKLSSMPRGQQTTAPLQRKCTVPYNTISIDHLGNCLLCECDGWLPLPVGKVLEFQTIEDVFSSSASKILQDDISNGNFSWCAVDHCGIRHADKIRKFLTLNVNIDESCNLHCPSCRREHVMTTDGPEYQYKLDTVNRILHWLKYYDKSVHIVMSGNGDPLASAIMRPLLQDWQVTPNQTFTLKTNGLLIKKQFEKLSILDQITSFSISVDAGSKEIYEDVRRPGRWELLIENFDFLQNINKSNITCLNFAFQNKNYKDLENFITRCNEYKFQGHVHELDDWGTWNIMRPDNPDTWTIQNGVFSDHNVLDIHHQNHDEAKNIINNNRHHKNIQFSSRLLQQIN